jgi:Ca2+-binding RTX toxin-like protein
VLIGNDGNDNLLGGLGRDLLVGGAGNDVFAFSAVNHSGFTRATADVIMDFQPGNDDINLAAIDANGITPGDQAFAFVATQNTNVVANSVTWFQDAANNQTIVQLDNNGNTAADMVIVLTGLHVLTAGDFVL